VALREPTRTSVATIPATAAVASPATLKRSDSFSALSTVVEEAESTDEKSETVSEAPASLFSTAEQASMVLPEAPADVPPMLIPAKNPKLYHLVQMSGEGSFWWDSTDSTDSGGLGPDFPNPDQGSGYPVDEGKSVPD
jgi:hypothetical protein